LEFREFEIGCDRVRFVEGKMAMTEAAVFARVEAGLEAVLEELRRREPIFHTQAFGMTAAERESVVAPEYWEVGASGRRYSRGFIQRILEERPPVDAVVAGWKCWDFGLRRLGARTYLLTYTLDRGGRITRRATLWEKTDDKWRILFHQGTIATGADDSLF
jgi:hypothetical protein